MNREVMVAMAAGDNRTNGLKKNHQRNWTSKETRGLTEGFLTQIWKEKRNETRSESVGDLGSGHGSGLQAFSAGG